MKTASIVLLLVIPFILWNKKLVRRIISKYENKASGEIASLLGFAIERLKKLNKLTEVCNKRH